MAAYGITKVFYIPVGFWLILVVECFSGESNNTITVQTGGSVTIPCHYDKKYTQQNKYWYSEIDKSSMYTNTTEQNLSVIDHPDQSLFTVTMRNLQSKHSGDYYCTVETGEQPPTIITYEPHLKIQSVPDVSVVSSSVSGHEGGDISVQCLYSSLFNKKLKQWCRYKDKSCYTVGRNDTSQNPSVQISDDGRRSFTVLMTGLRLTDSGWYCCSIGDLQVPVQLTVTKPKRAPTTIPAATPSDFEKDMHTTQSSANTNTITITTESRPETHIEETHPSLITASETVNSEIQSTDEQNKPFVILAVCLLVMLVLLLTVALVAIVTWRLRKKQKGGKIREEHLNSTRNAMSSENQMTSNSLAVDELSVIYSSVIHKAPLTSVNSEGDVIYSAVKKTPRL
ncbi:uncharacterized protein LOC127158057 [Labeo rohita]|uniref:uncharacterized protein LOC127158057 n=1 Tax=Labeo rohita TaxID=84645 RepID=UPI0021E1C4AF|nr:uncharacterized protein LOC127158057 [Labeo rohita]